MACTRWVLAVTLMVIGAVVLQQSFFSSNRSTTSTAPTTHDNPLAHQDDDKGSKREVHLSPPSPPRRLPLDSTRHYNEPSRPVRRASIPELLETPLSRKNKFSVGRRGDFGPPSSRQDPLAAFKGEYGWIFKKYHPSQLELDFMRDVVPYAHLTNWSTLVEKFRTRGEKLLALSKERVIADNFVVDHAKAMAECEVYVHDNIHQGGGGGGGAPGATDNNNNNGCYGSTEAMDKSIFSYFEYEFVCINPPCLDPVPQGKTLHETHESFIEPLFGAMRHPYVFLQKEHYYPRLPLVLNKEYMIVDKWALNNLYTRWRQYRRRSFYFDLGASTYSSGLGGASQSWFVALGDCMCVPFTSIHAWEAGQHPARTAWRQIPYYIHPHYHWYNYPLHSERDSWKNPMNHILEKVDLGDPVVLKVDFDNTKLEMEIINTILDTPELSSLIDEMFFEHHVKMAPMLKWWSDLKDSNITILDSLDLFTKMRTLGIRAHYWV